MVIRATSFAFQHDYYHGASAGSYLERYPMPGKSLGMTLLSGGGAAACEDRKRFKMVPGDTLNRLAVPRIPAPAATAAAIRMRIFGGTLGRPIFLPAAHACA